ncbi:uncharacterized protein DS421_10g303580 [Arachis hypogaea]|nr:uncharacterized protein DS421_10g303580 [Arachis hypogaea]
MQAKQPPKTDHARETKNRRSSERRHTRNDGTKAFSESQSADTTTTIIEGTGGTPNGQGASM